MKIENGKKYVFNTTESGLKKYNGTEVEIIRPLTEKEADIEDVGNMYKVHFHDGCESSAFEDELSLCMKTKIELTLSCFAPTVIMEIKIPHDRDVEEYINELLESILAEEFRYNAEWNFV